MKFKEFLESKGIETKGFEKMTAGEVTDLQKEFYDAQFDRMATAEELQMLQTELKNMPKTDDVAKLQDDVKDALDTLATMKENQRGFSKETVQEKVNKFISDNAEKIKEMHTSQSGVITLEVNKAPATVSTTNAQNIDPTNLSGVQQAPPSNANLRGVARVLNLVTRFRTNQSSLAYTETKPKDGKYKFVSEGKKKPKVDFTTETRYAVPKKIAAHIELTDEAVQDIPRLQSIAFDLLSKKHDIKKAQGVLNGTGVGAEPKGATKYGRVFDLVKLKDTVEDPTFMDVVNAVVTDIATTHNYEDETPYQANVVMINPIDFFKEVVSKKDYQGRPLYPNASVFNEIVTPNGVTVIATEDVSAGDILVADMTKYNVTDYIGYTVKIGMINENFIENKFCIVGESRFHAFVKKLDEQAFVFDKIKTIRDNIKKATTGTP